MFSSKQERITQPLRQITLAAMLLTVLYVQELVLSSIPNVQLTVVLIIVYGATLPLAMSLPIVIGYVLLDNLLLGSFSILYTPAMFFSWILLTLVAYALRNRRFIIILLFSIFFAFLYGWSFIPAKIIEQGINILWPYFLADLPFEAIMALNNAITVLFFYRHLKTILQSLIDPASISIDLE
jgi:hypothetical protein